MKTIKVTSNKIDTISDYISGVVHSFADDFMLEGAYITCKARDDELSDTVLHLVYIDYRFKGQYSESDLEEVSYKTGVNISIENEPYWMFGGNLNATNEYRYIRNLVNGHIIFDRNGNLAETRRLIRLENLTGDMEQPDIVMTEPPIQYKKK